VPELDAAGDRQDLQGEDLPVAVPAVVVAGGVRDGPPGQGCHLVVQAGLVCFDGQEPVGAAFGEVADVVAPAGQRVDGDDDTVQVADLVEQRTEAGDLHRKLT
jgi:hypothetical protein